MPGDLHNHSTCSDGSVPIHRLPQMAARVGLDTMAISDHDTLLSVRYCYEHPTQDGVRLIPATELTGYDYERHHRVHLLTFWPDPESPELIRHCMMPLLNSTPLSFAYSSACSVRNCG